MDVTTTTVTIDALTKTGVAGGCLLLVYLFGCKMLSMFEGRISGRLDQANQSLGRIEPKVDEMHARICPPASPHLAPGTDPDPGDAA